jgi:hypothetical protein
MSHHEMTARNEAITSAELDAVVGGKTQVTQQRVRADTGPADCGPEQALVEVLVSGAA